MASARVYEHKLQDGKIQKLGFIDLPQFYDNCAEHVETLIGRLKKEKVDGIVLDLRHNGGGILEESVNLVGLFIDKGPVVQVRNSEKKTTVYNDTIPKCGVGGAVDCVDEPVERFGFGNYGGGVAGLRARADCRRPKHAWERHGSASARSGAIDGEDPIPTPGKIKVTVSKFYRVAGSTTQKQGVTPDIVLPSVYDYLDLGESSLDNALEADNIAPAKYEALNEVKQFVPELEKDSKERVSRARISLTCWKTLRRSKNAKTRKRFR